MAEKYYNNIPSNLSAKDSKIRAFDTYYEKPLELDAGTYTAVKSFFTERGFDDQSSESISVIIIKQAKQDGYNAMQILDTLKGLDNVEISALVSEILNNNRFKTSFLGYALEFKPVDEVQRNIIA